MHQLSFFDESKAKPKVKPVLMKTDPLKLARRDSPETSEAAARGVDSLGLSMIVLEVIREFGEAGCISEQVRDRLAHLPYSSVTARFKGLHDEGFIEYVGERENTRGRMQRVMRAIN